MRRFALAVLLLLAFAPLLRAAPPAQARPEPALRRSARVEATPRQLTNRELRLLSIEEVHGDHMRAYLSVEEAERLRSRGIEVRWLLVDEVDELDEYPSYSQLETRLDSLATLYPSILQLDSVGTSHQGRTLWMMEISDNPGLDEEEPELLYISSIHGNEVVGLELCVRLIDTLASSYPGDPRLANLVDNSRLFVLPLMNPDGYEAGTRGNSQGVDLNRSFPDRIADPHPAPAARQPEVRAVMELFEEHSFALAANYHTGAVLVNYPWDSNPNYESVFTPTPDEDWYVELAHAYADNNPMMAGSTEFPGGITNGAAWYAIYGGLQDYSVAFHGTPHVTLELAEDHDVPHEQIPQYWADNEESMLAYLEMGLQGVRGVVTDASTGEPLAASVRVDHNPTEAFSDPDMGDYYRLLLPDTYVLYISSPGYQTRRIFDVEVTSGNYTRVDAALAPADSIYWASDGAEATRFHSEPVTGLDAWHTTAEDAWGDGLSWKCGATDSTTYPAGLDGAIVSEVVTVRPNTRLSFLHRIAAETEEDHYPQAWDGGVVEIRPEGQEQWHPLAPETGYPYTARNPDGGGPLPQGRGLFSGHEMWRESSCLLTGWEGPARIRFRFVSDGSVGYEGWYVDAVTLREVDLPALALADSFALPPTPLGETSTGQLQVRNTGSDWLELLAVTSSPPTVFHATLPEEARWVAPGDSVPVPVLFIPWEPGEVAGELELATTADTATVALLGTGTEDAGVEPGSGALPRELTLVPPWPNPFNSSASIRFGLPVATGAKLTIYDVLGRQVVRLVEGRRRPGWHLVHWDGRSEGGQPSASGTYIAVLEAGGHRAIRSFRLLR